MDPELEGIVQRMIEAGEPEENIATVIQGYQPQTRAQRAMDDPLVFGRRNADIMAGREPISTPGKILKDMAVQGVIGGALQGGAGLISKIPAGRLLTAGVSAAKAGAAKLPIVGPPLRAAAKAGMESWRATAPAAAAEAAPVVPQAVQAAAGPKPKLSAQEVAAKMREMYGSEKAGRMLYGTARPGVSAAARTESIRRLTPQMQSTLPKAAQNAINRELASSTPEEAFAYAAKATNDPARGYLGDLLRRTLLERGGK